MFFNSGLEKVILSKNLPIITFYDFFVLGASLWVEKQIDQQTLKRVPKAWDYKQAKNAIMRLEARRFLVPDNDFRSGVWRITQSVKSGSAEEVACIADPFSYVSHLSAMQKFGLTDRSPQSLHLTTPKRELWNILRDERMRKDNVTDRTTPRPLLSRPGFNPTIRRRSITVHVSSHPWIPTVSRGEDIRMTSIGQTFADMLVEPGLCGGMNHVLDVWKREAPHWLAEIIEAVNLLDSKIAKVRAGYILSEMLNIDHPVIHQWEQFAQRGGSRKLDPESEYVPQFSDRWMISINVN